MHISSIALCLPKGGNESIGSDDAFAPTEPMRQCNPKSHGPIRVAIADGASGSICSGLWAQTLADTFCRGRLGPDGSRWPVRQMARSWKRASLNRLHEQHGDNLPWYVEDKLEVAAHSSLLGLVIDRHPSQQSLLRWEAAAVGDSCLAHVAGNRVLATWPISNYEAFGNDPTLVPATDTAQIEVLAGSGTLEAGDRLYLMTDALAAWFLRFVDGPKLPAYAKLDYFLDHSRGLVQFTKWIGKARNLGEIKNDDVTLVRLAVE